MSLAVSLKTNELDKKTTGSLFKRFAKKDLADLYAIVKKR